jgi:hypothetical protein
LWVAHYSASFSALTSIEEQPGGKLKMLPLIGFMVAFVLTFIVALFLAKMLDIHNKPKKGKR